MAALSVVEHHDAARESRNFLLRSAGGSPQDLVIMYGLDESRHLPEHLLDLDGYGGSRPVRVGDSAFRQQHDMYGRLLDVANDVGLFAEQHDTDRDTLLGNFPQAFTHVALINSAHHLTCAQGVDASRRETPAFPGAPGHPTAHRHSVQGE